MRTIKTRRLFMGALVAALASTGCDESIFDVKNPGRILDEDLNTAQGVTSLVTGMSADFSVGVRQHVLHHGPILSDEIVGSGSYFSTGRYRRGLFDSEDANGFWGAVQRARWVAEGGLLRMQGISRATSTTVIAETAQGPPLMADWPTAGLVRPSARSMFSQPYDRRKPRTGGRDRHR